MVPAAILAYFVVQVMIAIATAIFPLASIPAAMGNYFSQLANSIAGPYAFVWCGAHTAPRLRFVVAIGLAVVLCVTEGVAFAWLLAHPRQQYPTWWLVFTNLVGLGAVIAAVFKCRD
jgi:hypothetical protein